MNLRRAACQYMRQIAPKQPNAVQRQVVEAYSLMLGKGEAFILPHGGHLFAFDTAIDVSLKDLHLPFPIMTMEWCSDGGDVSADGRTSPSATVVCAEEVESGFRLSVTWRFGNIWSAVPLVLEFGREANITVLDNGHVKVSRVQPLSWPGVSPELTNSLIRDMGVNYADECCVFAQLLLACNCSNVEPVSIARPSEKMQRASARRGNPPFDSYWTLSCALLSISDESSCIGGSHACPRLHVRRGHVRRLPTGKLTWVRQCMVGNADRGVVEKSYAVC